MQEFTYKNDSISNIKSSNKDILSPTSIVTKGYNSNEITIGKTIANNLKGEIFHKNFVEYLSLAYGSHNGIIIKPDYFWYTILSEIAIIVKDDVENFREVFTDSKDKKDIKILSDDPVIIDVNILTNEIFKIIPSILKKENIVCNFSTSTPDSLFAFTTCFLDTVSPYYNYMMFMCGFNKIKVLGDINDYNKMIENINTLIEIFSKSSKMIKYLNKVKKEIVNIILNFNNAEYWNKIFYLKQCGSGHQTEVKGWITEFFSKIIDPQYVSNFNTHISEINYKNLSTGKDYIMRVGLLSSIIEDDYLVPSYEYVIIEKIKNEIFKINKRNSSIS
jgi:hypothetical protein